MSNEVLTAARTLIAPGQVVEVRAITDDGIASGYFDSAEVLAAKVEALDGLPSVQGIYVTLNAVNPALLSRRANRIKMRLGKKDVTTADSDIVKRQWFPVDVDPVRPSGVSSTEQEHLVAIAKARRIAEYLSGMGWPAPLLADSGNGAHLLYRIDLENDDASRDLVKRCLEVLASMFNDAVAQVDTANFNAARIWKLYGTMSRKGDSTADRPHRRAAIIEAPETSGIVGRDMLTRLAGVLPDIPAVPATVRPAAEKRGPACPAQHWISDTGSLTTAFRSSPKNPIRAGRCISSNNARFLVYTRMGLLPSSLQVEPFTPDATTRAVVQDLSDGRSCGSGLSRERSDLLQDRTAPHPGSYNHLFRPPKISTLRKPYWCCGLVTRSGPCCGPLRSTMKATKR